MLALYPALLDTHTLSEIYAIYAAFPVVSLSDLGLSNRVYCSSGLPYLTGGSFRRALSLRILLLNAIAIIFSLVFLRLSALSLALFQVGVNLLYITILTLNVWESFYSNELSYKMRILGEAATMVLLVVSAWVIPTCHSVSPFIASVCLGRSIPPLVLTLRSKNKFRSLPIHHDGSERNFTAKNAIVGLLGYFSGYGSILILKLNFHSDVIAGYSQAFLMTSTLHSLTMSIFLYNQRAAKTLPESVIKSYIRTTFVRLAVVYVALVTGSVTIAFAINAIYPIILFNKVVFVCLAVSFIGLIYNHLVASVYRVRGRELLFVVSITGGTTQLILLATVSTLNEITLVALAILLNGAVFNWLATYAAERRQSRSKNAAQAIISPKI